MPIHSPHRLSPLNTLLLRRQNPKRNSRPLTAHRPTPLRANVSAAKIVLGATLFVVETDLEGVLGAEEAECFGGRVGEDGTGEGRGAVVRFCAGAAADEVGVGFDLPFCVCEEGGFVGGG